MAVSVMTFDPAGEMRNRFTFAEGVASVNFGEEIVRIQDISFKTKSDKKDGGKKKEGGASAGEPADGSGAEGAGSGESNTGDTGGAFGDNG